MAEVLLVIQPGTVFQDMDSMYAIGLLCGLISGLLYACIILTSRYLKGYYTGTAQAACAIIITLIIFLPYSAAISSGILLENLYLLDLLLASSSNSCKSNALQQLRLRVCQSPECEHHRAPGARKRCSLCRNRPEPADHVKRAGGAAG